MSTTAATDSVHVALADQVRALLDLVAAHSFDDASASAAAERLEAIRQSLAESATPVPTRQPLGLPRWPVARSAVSGPLNPYAPPVIVAEHDDHVEGLLTYSRALQGPPEHAHGGHLAMVFDHLAGRAAGRTGKPIVTGRLSVRYLAPTPVGRPIRFTARVRESRHSLVTVECASYAGDMKTATAEIMFVELGPRHFVSAFGDVGRGAES